MNMTQVIAAVLAVVVFNGLGLIHLRWPWLVRKSRHDWGSLTGESQKILALREVLAYHRRVGWTLQVMGVVMAVVILLG